MIGATSLVGTRLGNYEVQALIGRGGMASVYRGFDHNLHRPVAIKVLSGSAASQPDVALRFQQEARLIAQLRHPNIVQVYDFGEALGYTYMVQELLSGPSLEQQLAAHVAAGSSFSRDDIISITKQLASALDAAHSAGMIHRDVKPANAIWNGVTTLVLTDFGIAKAAQASVALTQAGMVFGTPNYVSPEQGQGLPLTPASDIYSLGVTVYELISGKLPFVSETPLGVVLGHIQSSPPPLLPLRPDLPPTVEGVIAQVLAKDPAQRFTSAGEFARALERGWAVAPAVPPPSPSLNIHNQATSVWQGTPRAATGATRSISTQAPSAPHVSATPDAAVPPLMTRQSRKGVPLVLMLGGLLALLLLAGAAMAMRGEPPSSITSATPAGDIAAAIDPEASPTPNVDAVVVSDATAEPVAQPTPEPSPAPQPTDAPAQSEPPVVSQETPADPFDRLRLLLDTANANGQVEDGKDLLKKLDESQSAVAAGNTEEAAKKLNELVKKLEDSKKVAPDVRDQALSDIVQIFATYGLDAQQDDEGGGNDDKDEDKGKDKD